ncbi:unnamed protein product, partial [Medioppia subpectinata]
MCTTNKPNYTIRCIRAEDFQEVRDLWASIGFSIHKYANDVMIKSDPNGLFVAEDIDSGKILGYCAAVINTHDFAFIGGFCVRPEYRGHGIGKYLWNTGMAHMGDRNIGLFAFSYKMFEVYRDHNNFTCVPDRHILHFRGPYDPNNDIIDKIDGISLVSINESNLRDVIEYDKDLCGIDRSVYIEGISKSPESVNLVAINEKNQVLGYCVVLALTTGTTGIEPLYADNEQIAELLANKCCQRLPKNLTQELIYKCWNINDKSKVIAMKLGLKEKRDQMSCFTKKVGTGKLDKVFSIAS